MFFNSKGCSYLDWLNEANLLLVNLKEIIEDLQAKNSLIQTQLDKVTMKNKKLTIENKQLIVYNKNLCCEVNFLKEQIKGKSIGLVC